MIPQRSDLNGVELETGDQVAYARREGNSGLLQLGTVESFQDRKGMGVWAVVKAKDSGRSIRRPCHSVAIIMISETWENSE